MSRPSLPWISAFSILLTPAVGLGQQVLEVDYDAGRIIIDDEWRGLRSHFVAVDWDRATLYAADSEEPEGIMAFSLETGEWLRTIGTPRGDGPHEFPWGRKGIAIAPGGGLYVSGDLRVIEYSAEGTPVNSWRPEAPTLQRVCNLNGVPAVPTQGGVVRRGTEGTSEPVGPVEAQGRRVGGNDIEGVYRRLRSARIACHGSVAFVSMPFGAAGPDSLFVYDLNGQHGRLAVPVEDASGRRSCMIAAQRRPDGSIAEPERPCPHWSRNTRLSADDRGNLVMLGLDQTTRGAIINPETGCYALIRGSSDHPHSPVAVYADSVLVYRHSFEKSTKGDQTRIHITDSATGVSIHPLRRVSGEPCPGMLPSVRLP